jgi:hypothetical protein
MKTELAPTTQSKVESSGNVSFDCSVELSDTEKIIIYVEVSEYDSKQMKYVEVTEKFQLEKLSYYTPYNEHEVKFTGGTIRGFRKDGGLKVRTTWIPVNQRQAVLNQIPDNYHDYARKAFAKKMIDLQQQLNLMTNGGIKL